MTLSAKRYNMAFISQAITVTAAVTLVCYIMYTLSPEVIAHTGCQYLYLTTVFVILGILRYMQLTSVDGKSGDPTHLLYHDRFLQTGVYDLETPAPTTDNSNNEHEVSEFHIENGSFLRLKTLTLGYTIPKALQEKAKIQNARIYLQAQNLFTITGYSGADPEGLGYPYALPRQFTMGFQLGF